MEDPFAESRELNDKENTLDHFYIKLLKLPDLLHTDSAKIEANARLEMMMKFLEQLRSEI